jgi:hypothetical protein
MDAICANQDIRHNLRSVFKARLDAITSVSQCIQAAANMQTLWWQRSRQHRQHVSAMTQVMGKTECVDRGLGKWRAQQRVAILPTSLMPSGRLHAQRAQFVVQSEMMQNSGGVRADDNSCTAFP